MKRILIIDDDIKTCRAVELTLTCTTDWTVLHALDGESGCRLAACTQPDAILLDRMMPGLDGWATMKLVKANQMTAHIPVVLLTNRETDLAEVKAGAFHGFLRKPFDPLRLAAQIADLLGWPIPQEGR